MFELVKSIGREVDPITCTEIGERSRNKSITLVLVLDLNCHLTNKVICRLKLHI